MKYYAQARVLHENVSKVGHWTMWQDRFCRVKELKDNTAVLTGIDQPVATNDLTRFVEVIYAAYNAPNVMIDTVVNDDDWSDFIGIVSDSAFEVITTTDYGRWHKMAVIRKTKNDDGLRLVIGALDKAPSASHDDMFEDGSLIKGAIYSITGNISVASTQFPKRPDNETIKVLSEAAASFICEIDRIQRKQHAKTE